MLEVAVDFHGRLYPLDDFGVRDAGLHEHEHFEFNGLLYHAFSITGVGPLEKSQPADKFPWARIYPTFGVCSFRF